MRYLRTNTATRITVGPFLDKTDGITPEVALTVTSEKLTLVVDDGGVPTLVLDVAPTASGGSNDMVHITGDDSGYYDLELAAANVNYLGRALLSLNDVATHCPVFHEFMILPAVIYDAMILGTDLFDVSMTQILGTAVATPDVAGILDVNAKKWANQAIPTPNVTGVPKSDVTHFGSSPGTFASGRPEVNATHLLGTAFSPPTVAGIPNVNVKTWADLTTVALPLVPTTAGRTLDVSAGGEAGLDWANVGSPTTTVGLSGTTVGVATLTTTTTNLTNLPTIPANWLTAAGTAADFGTEIAAAVWDLATSGHTTSGTFGAAMNAAGSAGDPWATALPGSYGSGTAGKIVGDNINTTISSRLATSGYTAPLDAAGTRTAVGLASANLDTQLAAIAAYVDTEISTLVTSVGASLGTNVSAIKTQTDKLVFTVTNQVDANVLDWKSATAPAMTGDAFARLGSPAGASVSADIAAVLAKWTTAMTESYNADGSAPTPVQALFGILQRLTEFSIAGTTITVKKLDGSTTAMTLTLDSSTAPTSSTRAT